MSKASLRLTKYTAEYDYDPDQRKGWAIMVRDSEIFVYHRMGDVDAYEGDLFEAVASVNQYYEIPKNAPKVLADGKTIPYYRRNQMEVFARSPRELNEIWEYLKVDVSRLIADLNSSEVLTAFSGANIGDDGDIETYDLSEATVSVSLSWEPAGNWNGTTITAPDSSKKGWLPISEFENTIANPVDSVPSEALWFYNRGADSLFDLFFNKVATPYSLNLLELNAVMLLQGSSGAYDVTKDTVFWLNNSNASLEGVQKNPWPDDYIDGLDPSYPPVLRLILPAF